VGQHNIFDSVSHLDMNNLGFFMLISASELIATFHWHIPCFHTFKYLHSPRALSMSIPSNPPSPLLSFIAFKYVLYFILFASRCLHNDKICEDLLCGFLFIFGIGIIFFLEAWQPGNLTAWVPQCVSFFYDCRMVCL